MEATLAWPGRRAGDVTDHPDISEVRIPDREDFGALILRVRGRLEGGEEADFLLRLDYPMDALGCVDFRVAAIGADGAGGGAVLTEEGVLELTGSSLRIGSTGNVAVIDAKTLRRRDVLSPGWARDSWPAELVVRRDGGTAWKTPRACLDLESGKRFSVLPDHSCVGSSLAKAGPGTLRRVREGGVFLDRDLIERLKYDLYELTGAPVLVYIWGVACT